jgi:general secretion pathway protein H
MRLRRGQSGFTLLEIVCVLAIVAMLAAVALPDFPRRTSRTKLESYAIATAALLKADRNSATTVTRKIRSGATGQSVQIPADIGFDAVLAQVCRRRAAGTTIDFFPSGMSCGGTIILSRLGTTFEIRVNWLTGGVEIVQAAAT